MPAARPVMTVIGYHTSSAAVAVCDDALPDRVSPPQRVAMPTRPIHARMVPPWATATCRQQVKSNHCLTRKVDAGMLSPEGRRLYAPLSSIAGCKTSPLRAVPSRACVAFPWPYPISARPVCRCIICPASVLSRRASAPWSKSSLPSGLCDKAGDDGSRPSRANRSAEYRLRHTARCGRDR